MVEWLATPKSRSRQFHFQVDESPSSEAYCNPPGRSGLNLTIIQECPAQIEEDECDRWFPLALEQGGDDEEEGIQLLEHRRLHHSPTSIASSPAPPQPISGTRDRPRLVAPQYIIVEESLVPLRGVKNRPCLVEESPPEER